MKSINVTLWLNCNLKCPYCFANPIAPPKEWSDATQYKINKLICFLNDTGPWDVVFTGGEPTINPGFFKLCVDLTRLGHQVSFISNGIVRLAECFSPTELKGLRNVTLSYQITHEKNTKHATCFRENIRYLVENGTKVTVNYVLYPDRVISPASAKKEFKSLGAEVKFLAFQGDYKGIAYPRGYSDEDKNIIREIGDIRSRYVLENGEYIPTFKKCRAGFEFFSLSLHTGGIYVCEQLQHTEIANLFDEDAVRDFNENVFKKAMPCPAKKCFCRFTVEQEKFLSEKDVHDMKNYSEWESISLPSPRALKYWQKKELNFVDELCSKFKGEKVIIWGGGMHTQSLLSILKANRFNMEKFELIIDSNTLKQGGDILGIDILSVKAAKNQLENCSDVIISSRSFEDEIYQELLKHVTKDKNIIKLYDGSMSSTMESFN